MKNKTVVITGGASGIGLAMVKKFAAEHWNVFFIDTNQVEGEKVEEELKEKAYSVSFLNCNITQSAAVKAIFEAIPGKIDTLINNAGISHIGKVENTSEEDFEKLFQVNVKGSFLCIQAALAKLKQDGGGSILNMASVAATIGIPDRFAYSMTKGAMLTMTLSIARDYVADGIRCNCISPGRVHTPFVDGFIVKTYPGQEKEMFEKLASTQPIGRMGSPEEFAELVKSASRQQSKIYLWSILSHFAEY